MRKIFSLSFFLVSLIVIAQDIPSYTITVCKPETKGYYFCSLLKVDEALANFNQCHLILNHKGEIVYSKQFPKGELTCDFKLQPNGLISYYYKDKFYLMDSTFKIKDSVFCKNGILKDAHELLILDNGNYALLGNEIDVKDLSGYSIFTNKRLPGSKRANVKCGVLQEQDSQKNVIFEWHAKDHYDFMDVDPFYLNDTLHVDWNHFNSIERDTDGNYIVSSRYLNEATKINRANGAIIWRLGGKKNQFTFINDKNKFIGQHDVRRIANNSITLLDNGRKDSVIRPAIAKEYKMDEKNMTVELVWSYTDTKNANSIYSGSVSRLNNGNTLIDYGSSNNSRTLFNVVNKKNEKVFEIIFSDTLGSYRAFNYSYLPWKINQPVITSYTKENKVFLDAGKGFAAYEWSTGETSQTIEITKEGSYTVKIPHGQNGFLHSKPFLVESKVQQKKN